MTIDEYREKIISVVKEMEAEHGFEVKKVTVDTTKHECGFTGWPVSFARTYEVDIEA